MSKLDNCTIQVSDKFLIAQSRLCFNFPRNIWGFQCFTLSSMPWLAWLSTRNLKIWCPTAALSYSRLWRHPLSGPLRPSWSQQTPEKSMVAQREGGDNILSYIILRGNRTPILPFFTISWSLFTFKKRVKAERFQYS